MCEIHRNSEKINSVWKRWIWGTIAISAIQICKKSYKAVGLLSTDIYRLQKRFVRGRLHYKYIVDYKKQNSESLLFVDYELGIHNHFRLHQCSWWSHCFWWLFRSAFIHRHFPIRRFFTSTGISFSAPLAAAAQFVSCRQRASVRMPATSATWGSVDDDFLSELCKWGRNAML